MSGEPQAQALTADVEGLSTTSVPCNDRGTVELRLVCVCVRNVDYRRTANPPLRLWPVPRRLMIEIRDHVKPLVWR